VRVLIALGGNALLPRGQAPDAQIQVDHVASVAPALAAAGRDHQLIITHGNGPQIGMLSMESGDDDSISQPYPLDALVAETQGLIGYWLQQSIAAAGLGGPIVSVVTQTVVDADDPGFDDPTKFIGATYSESDAKQLAKDRGWEVKQDGDHWRRVVASPMPVGMVETDVLAQLVDSGVTVICAGGGGAPVVVDGDGHRGVEAVVDKDHVAAMLALDLHADLLVLLTDVPAVYLDYGTDHQRALGQVSVDDVSGTDFPAGSMRPKVEAAAHFARQSGHPAAIGALDDLADVLDGRAGTHITPADDS
jgi:carbamate kinase